MTAMFRTSLLLLAGCLSSEGASEQWAAWVDDHNACEQVSDCVIVYTECPLGCASAVHADFEDEAEEEADRLVRRYESGGRSCAYDCREPGDLVCEADGCQIDYDELAR